MLIGGFKVDKQDGVDNDQPPNNKLFDPTFQDAADTALLARRARNQKDTTSNFTLNIPGLGELLRPPATEQRLPPVACPKIIPKVALEFFCEHYELTEDIYYKLMDIKLTGPHALQFLTNDDLRGEGGLLTAEVADVRDAQERWENEEH
jgi:hypothetical protein